MRRHFLSIALTAVISTSVCAEQTFVHDGVTYTYTEAMTAKTPPTGYIKQEDDEECRGRLEKYVGISPKVFSLLELTEGGYNGMAKSWPTKSGGKTWDTGKYSVNQVNWDKVYPKLTPIDLRWNDCASLVLSAIVVQEFYEAAKKKFKQDIIDKVDPITALNSLAYNLAGYNSKTPTVRERYKNRILTMLGVNLFQGEIVGLWD